MVTRAGEPAPAAAGWASDGATIQVRAGDGVIGKAAGVLSLSTGRNSYVKARLAGTIEVGWQRPG
jgi:hypothetical protein